MREISLSQEFRLNAPQITSMSSCSGGEDDSSLSSIEESVEKSPIDGGSQQPTTETTKVSKSTTQPVTLPKSSMASTDFQEEMEEEEASRRFLFVVGLIVIVLLVGGIVAILLLTLGDEEDHIDIDENPETTEAPSVTFTPSVEEEEPRAVINSPTLQNILNRGALKCGVPVSAPGFSIWNAQTGFFEGFDIDLVCIIRSVVDNATIYFSASHLRLVI
jgi:hypothetical protein